MIFTNRRTDTCLDLHIAIVKIERKSETRFLGVIIDEKLTWKSHINSLKAKMARYIGIMYRLKGLVPLKVHIKMYHSFVQSHSNYYSLVWVFSA